MPLVFGGLRIALLKPLAKSDKFAWSKFGQPIGGTKGEKQGYFSRNRLQNKPFAKVTLMLMASEKPPSYLRLRNISYDLNPFRASNLIAAASADPASSGSAD